MDGDRLELTQRAASGVGRGRVVARAVAGGTSLAEAHATSPLRFVRPTFPGSRAAAVCLVTFGGGLVDGDAVDLDLVVEEGATLVVFTQSSTKVFRGSSCQALRADVRGTLVVLPDPVACFAGARYRQRVDVALSGDGTCVLLDGFTAGRPAYGERWAMRAIDATTTVSRDGRLLVRDALALDGDDLAARLERFDALCTLIAVGPRAAPLLSPLLARADEHPRAADVVAAPSELAACRDAGVPGAIVRLAATSPARAIGEARRRLRNLPDIDVVDPFASRS